jgi:hypothetical protein
MGLDFVSGQYGCLFSRCRKYVINSLIHGHFHFGLVIIPRPILALDSVSGQYEGLGMITRPIWKCPYINLYLFTHTGVQNDFHIRRCSCRLTVTRRVPLVEQELLTLSEHLGSPPVLSGVRVARSLIFCVMFCSSLFVLFLWPLCCLCFFDLRLLITSFVSLIFSYNTASFHSELWGIWVHNTSYVYWNVFHIWIKCQPSHITRWQLLFLKKKKQKWDCGWFKKNVFFIKYYLINYFMIVCWLFNFPASNISYIVRTKISWTKYTSKLNAQTRDK